MNNVESPLLVLPSSDISKEGIKIRVDQVTSLVTEGKISAVEATVKLKAITKIATEILKGIEEDTKNEITNEGVHESSGFQVKVSTGRQIINYEEDAEYARLKEALKAREEILKSAVSSSMKAMSTVDEDGVIVEAPSVKHGKGSVSVLFK